MQHRDLCQLVHNDYHAKPFVALGPAVQRYLELELPALKNFGYCLPVKDCFRVELIVDPRRMFPNLLTREIRGETYVQIDPMIDMTSGDMIHSPHRQKTGTTSTATFSCSAITPLAQQADARRMDRNTTLEPSFSEVTRAPSKVSLTPAKAWTDFSPRFKSQPAKPKVKPLIDLDANPDDAYNHSDFPRRPTTPDSSQAPPPRHLEEPDELDVTVTGLPPFKHPSDSTCDIEFPSRDHIHIRTQEELNSRAALLVMDLCKISKTIVYRCEAIGLGLTSFAAPDFRVPATVARRNLILWYPEYKAAFMLMEAPLVKALSHEEATTVTMCHTLHSDRE